MRIPFRLSAAAGFFVGVSMLATPVAAIDLPDSQQTRIETGVADQAGWGRRRHRDNGIDAGDIFAGVLVIGAIAAIAGAADNDNDRRREQRYPEYDHVPEYRENSRSDMRSNYQSSRGIDSAVAMCVDQIERGSDRVDSVDNASRTGDGWRVSGSLEGGSGWNCWIDNDGRIREVDLAAQGEAFSTAPVAGRQLSDEEYARARAAHANAAQTLPANSTQPAYPGGPLPGEEGYEEAVQLSSAN